MENDYKKKVFWISLIIHLCAVIFSEGFHRPDEHLGVMRWMSFKLGLMDESLLSWEYPAQIRPWLQPFLFYCFVKPFYALGLSNPFFISFILRLICSTLGFYSLYLIAKIGSDFVKSEKWKNYSFLMIMLLWFLPFFHARTTSENLGMSFFVFAVYILFKNIPKQRVHWSFLRPFDFAYIDIKTTSMLTAGFLLGVSFILRFQMAFMIFPLGLWILIYSKVKVKSISYLAIGFLLSLTLMIITDYWGYGEWVFSPWNYFDQNILKGVASGFGVDPWHYYFRKIVSRGIPPLSLLMLIPALWFWIKKPGHLLTWITLPYFLVHSYVGHKEVRFIFALGMIIPIVAAIFLEEVEKRRTIPKWILIFLLIQNSLLLIGSSLKDAYTPIEFYKYLYNKSESTPVIYTLNKVRDQMFFYQKEPIRMIWLQDFNQAISKIKKGNKVYFLTNRISDAKKFDDYKGCTREFSTFPKWIIKTFPKLVLRSKSWSLTACTIL